jgi:hypothetical protein
LLFNGPYASIEQIENESGIFVAICGKINRFIVVDIGESNRIKSLIEKKLKEKKYENFCSGELFFACHYMIGKNQNERNKIKNIIRNEYLPLVVKS